MPFLDIFEPLGIWSDYQFVKLLNCFFAIDNDHSGKLDAAEYLVYLEVPDLPFNRSLFSLESHGNVLAFPEWVVMTATFAMSSEGDLCEYIFQLYKNQESGRLNMDNLDNLLRHVVSHIGEVGLKGDNLLRSTAVDARATCAASCASTS